MKVDVGSLNKPEKEYILSQYSLVELYQELHRRANQDIEEDEEPNWEEEIAQLHYEKLVKHFPHFFPDKEVK